jgi:hypothetical protein
MMKFIFIISLFFCSLESFSQKVLPNSKMKDSDFSVKTIEIEQVKAETEKKQFLKELDIDLLTKDNLCEILSIKVSDLLNESMLKKLRANV